MTGASPNSPANNAADSKRDTRVRYSAAELAHLLGLPQPTRQQVAIITAPLEPVLVIAGAGSGKTETMAARVVWLVANGLVRPEEILGLTFTRKAAGELSARIRARLAQLVRHDIVEAIGEPTVSTYHAYAIRVVSEHGLRAGYEPTSRLVTEAVSWQYADAVVRSYDGDMSYVESAPATVTSSVLELVGQLAENLRTPAELAQWTERFCQHIEAMPYGPRKRATPAPVKSLLARQRAREQLLPLLERYTKHKRTVEAMDFADQVARAAELARDHPEVGAAERTRYRVVLLDEYQDTSYAQLVLLSSLFGKGHPVTAVGDPCQSIYGWRGASAGNLTRFPRDFPRRRGTPARIAPLTVSWRNAPAILDVANTIATTLRAASPVPVPALEPRPDREAPGVVECALHNTIQDEATWLAERIAKLWAMNPDTPPTTAVLVRKRSQFERIATALREAGLPVEIVGLGGLLATPEVRDVVATLTVLSDPTAGSALMRLLTGARWRIGPRDIAALGQRAKEIDRQRAEDSNTELNSWSVQERTSIVEALDDLGIPERFSRAGYTRLQMLAEELRVLRTRVGDPVPELVMAVERTLRLDIELVVRRPQDPASARANLDAFVNVAASFADSATSPTISAFLAFLVAAEAEEYGLPAGRVEVHEGAVQLLTVHAAKGLEWDVVAVPGMSNKVFPSEGKGTTLWTTALGTLPFPLRGDHADLPQLLVGDAENQAEVAIALEEFKQAWQEHQFTEERRLAYVALTRARERLLCSGYWWDMAQKPRGASVFLEEIHDYCQTAGHPIAFWVSAPDDEAENPLTATPNDHDWPFDPLADRRNQVAAGAQLVTAAMAGEDLDAELADEEGQQWSAEAELLLAERAQYHNGSEIEVLLPTQLTVSQLVMLRVSPEELAQQIRRPMPQRPTPGARRGTTFHAWLERRFKSEHLLDLDELPGAADDTAGDGEYGLSHLQQAFEASVWADRIPIATEVSFVAKVDQTVIRGRMDAVFADDQGGFEVIDWKTGALPHGQTATAFAVQLAAYRLAWAQLAEVGLDQVRAGFHYVRANRTVRPVDLLDADGLAELITQLPYQYE